MQWWFLALLPILPPPAADWAFQERQERFVLEAVGIGSAVHSLPHESADALKLMASDDYRAREVGSKILRQRGDARACFIGQWLGDPEVRLRCRNVLRRLSDCPQCEGRGGRQESWGLATCGYCRGAGHFWPPDDWEGM